MIPWQDICQYIPFHIQWNLTNLTEIVLFFSRRALLQIQQRQRPSGGGLATPDTWRLRACSQPDRQCARPHRQRLLRHEGQQSILLQRPMGEYRADFTVEKKTIFCQFFSKNVKFSAIFWHSNGNFPEDQADTIFKTRVVSPGLGAFQGLQNTNTGPNPNLNHTPNPRTLTTHC